MTNPIPDLIENPKSRPRQYKTQLPPDLYMKLELEALKRGITPFKLTEALVTAWISGFLISLPPTQAPKAPLSPSSSVAGSINPPSTPESRGGTSGGVPLDSGVEGG